MSRRCFTKESLPVKYEPMIYKRAAACLGGASAYNLAGGVKEPLLYKLADILYVSKHRLILNTPARFFLLSPRLACKHHQLLIHNPRLHHRQGLERPGAEPGPSLETNCEFHVNFSARSGFHFNCSASRSNFHLAVTPPLGPGWGNF